MKKTKNNKQNYIDDGHTVFSMENLDDKRPKKSKVDVTKSERRAIIKAAFETYFPFFMIVVLSFALVFTLMYLWLK